HGELTVGDVGLGEGEVDQSLAAFVGVEGIGQEVGAVDTDAGYPGVVHRVPADRECLGAPGRSAARLGDRDARRERVGAADARGDYRTRQKRGEKRLEAARHSQKDTPELRVARWPRPALVRLADGR